MWIRCTMIQAKLRLASTIVTKEAKNLRPVDRDTFLFCETTHARAIASNQHAKKQKLTCG